MEQRAKNRRILFACNTLIIAWLLIIAFVIFFVIGVIHGTGVSLAWMAGTVLFGSVGAGATYLYFAFSLRCEICNHKLFIETPGPIHPTATKVWHLDYWPSAVIEVVLRRNLTCMHCGKRYSLHSGNI